jgi:hypothetical protein
MSIVEIWQELEETPTKPEGGGRLQRRVGADSSQDMHVELILPDRRRAISLTVPQAAIKGHEELPRARGLEHRLVRGHDGVDGVTLALELTDPAAGDLFAVLAEDLVSSTASAGDAELAVGAWTGRVTRWQHLLRSAPRGLVPELQRALYAELWILDELIGPVAGNVTAVRSWFGPDRSRHDFQLPGTSIEVKSCAANQPQIVSINGERQLDETGTPALHLTHVSLDVHHNGPESLLEMVGGVRESVAGTGVETDFEDRLLEYGFLDMHAPSYDNTGYTIRDIRHFRVVPGFPRLIEADLPEGVGRVRYRLAIAACVDHEVDWEEISSLIKEVP